ncbi:MAG: DUF2235 domain-containing protein [Candidatus Thiodiazotropha sp.]
MARKLVLCSDGTGNSGSKARGTNVWRFYKAVDTDPTLDQLTFYQDGVGTQNFKLFRLFRRERINQCLHYQRSTIFHESFHAQF